MTCFLPPSSGGKAASQRPEKVSFSKVRNFDFLKFQPFPKHFGRHNCLALAVALKIIWCLLGMMVKLLSFPVCAEHVTAGNFHPCDKFRTKFQDVWNHRRCVVELCFSDRENTSRHRGLRGITYQFAAYTSYPQAHDLLMNFYTFGDEECPVAM